MLTTILSMTLGLQSANAEPVTMDINKAKDPGPGFGTRKDRYTFNRCQK